ncbi:Proteophosphoglycan ppg4 [Rhodotorula toruloides ATCC 204091]|uniref:Proteophosphoglycan ppg4 n=1 Tax=Rhodotorula toruloides TaxID=5286 RepID=A0A0K3C7Y0_RHOTO|nr:Proteophosphoglycan ppg4 [Rhodotorula toruloides ATCC 204091]KAK4331568.1 Proteophosphoglycan ppg4 [Rhodotorula toruloides]PRQ77968.1 Proteophosphoglycan ppg4 [Rhodotorula toruloides]
MLQPYQSPADLSSLPPELLLKILTYSLTTALLSPTLLVNGQFTTLRISCPTCAFRNVAGVCKTWRAIAREVTGREVVLPSGCGGSERDEQAVRCLKADAGGAAMVRSVDASLRSATFDGPTFGTGFSFSPLLSGQSLGLEFEPDEVAGLSTRQARLEVWHKQCVARSRQRLVWLLSVCQNLTTLDVDLGFFVDLRDSPSLVPPSLRSLALRNAHASDVVSLLQQLHCLEDLTLRLALDCFPPADFDVPSDTLPSLRRFELSTTAFGTTSLPFVLSLLSNSHASLKSLTLRNKGATKPTTEAFLPVARGLIERFAERLEELAVKDIPRGGRRAPGDGPLDWFPLRPTSFPRLRNLHLTGLACPSPSFFTQRLTLPSPADDASSDWPSLHSLTIEDFDSPSPSPLVEALETVPALSRLEVLRVAFAMESTAAGEDVAMWQEGRKAIEGWCKGEKRETGRRTRLVAGWQVVRVEQAGMW